MGLMRDDIVKPDRVFIIAEIGSNHNGSFEKAAELIGLAAKTGVDAVKFQIYRSERKVQADMAAFPSVRHLARTQLERWKSLEFSNEQWADLSAMAHDRGLLFVATVCDNRTVDELDPVVDIHKIASGDASNSHLIEYVAATGKPVVMSTGMSLLSELEQTVPLIPADRLVLLHCVAAYPTPLDQVNLACIPHLQKHFRVPVGYSDHTIGKLACLAAVAMGAPVIEKHFTFDKSIPFADHALSAEPDELKKMVEDIRMLSGMWGVPRQDVYDIEMAFRKIRQRGLYAAVEIPGGTVITSDMLIPMLPLGKALPVSRLPEALSRRAVQDIRAGKPITASSLSLDGG